MDNELENEEIKVLQHNKIKELKKKDEWDEMSFQYK